jgi:hypothetical protein
MGIRRVIWMRTVPRSPDKVKCNTATLGPQLGVGRASVLFTAVDAL